MLGGTAMFLAAKACVRFRPAEGLVAPLATLFGAGFQPCNFLLRLPHTGTGAYESVKEDERGLFVEGMLLVKDVALAREAFALMKSGVVTGLSIGYWVRESSFDEKTGIRTLTRVDLEEVSVVTMPANDEARIDAIKLKLAHGGLPTLPEFERLLRDSGFSRSQAATVAAYGLETLLRDAEGAANTTATSDLMTALSGFSLPKL
jgi:hypothetical protein